MGEPSSEQLTKKKKVIGRSRKLVMPAWREFAAFNDLKEYPYDPGMVCMFSLYRRTIECPGRKQRMLLMSSTF